MFTGIIEANASIISTRKKDGASHVRIALPRGWKLRNGQSVSIDGVCSTVEEARTAHFEVTYMPETLRVSTAGSFATGTIVNLERSLRARDRLDGHIVQGHVDGVGIVTAVRTRGDSKEVTITVPRSLMHFIAPKGSIAVNGVSLTVAAQKGNSFTVALVPHTLSHTTFGTVAKSARVNIETDLIARYLAALKRK